MRTQFSNPVPLRGSEKTAPLTRAVKEINKEELLSVTIRVKSKNEFPDLLNASVNQKFETMTRAAFEKHFGASSRNMQKVEDFVQHFGLSIIESNINQRTVEVQGTVLQMEEAFNVELTNYENPSAQQFRGRTGQINVPQEISDVVQGVFGLDNRLAARVKIRYFDENNSNVRQHSTPNAAFFPNQLARIYNYPSDATGKNQCIAIVELGGGFRKKDITAYFKKLKLKAPKVVAVSVDGAHNSPSTANSADGEVMLDIEVAAGVAPAATVVVYFAPNTDKGFLDAINAAVHDKKYKPSVISISWGAAEKDWTQQSLTAYNQAFQAAAMMGVTICAAAGDSGSDDSVGDGLAHVDFPASSPYVLSCGGTKLNVDATGKILSEVVWHESNDSATGGGISEVFPMPSYQLNAMIPASVNSGFKGRGVPDLAAVADPATGYNVLVDGQTMVIGGTSAVAPLMSGLIARINEKLKKSVGFIHPKLYAHPDVCNDVVQGDNKTVTGNRGYAAATGWDACTGYGSANGVKLMSVLQ